MRDGGVPYFLNGYQLEQRVALEAETLSRYLYGQNLYYLVCSDRASSFTET